MARAGHIAPQAPQCITLVRVSTSQPLVASLSQLLKPALHDTPQVPAAQVALPLARRGQALSQRPQWSRLVPRAVSQPLAALLSQLPKPAAQAPRPHMPALHTGVPLEAIHAVPQAPQWAALVRRSTSQPLLGSLSQSAKCSAQV